MTQSQKKKNDSRREERVPGEGRWKEGMQEMTKIKKEGITGRARCGGTP